MRHPCIEVRRFGMRPAGYQQFYFWLLLLTIVFLNIQGAAQTRISASDLDHLVQDKRYPQLERQLQLADLSSIDRAYFTGIVADRNNHPEDAILDLEKVLPELRKTSPRHTAVALRTLAGDYFK